MQQPTNDEASEPVPLQPNEVEAAVTVKRNVERVRRRRGARARSTIARPDVSTGQADAGQIATAMAVVR